MILEAHHGAPGLRYMVKHELKDIACQLKAKGCQLRVVTMLREPYERFMSGLIYNTAWANGVPEEENALKFINDNSELQARYLLKGHPKQWVNESWRRLAPAHTIDDELIQRAQHTLSYSYLVGNSENLDEFTDAIFALLGLPRRKSRRIQHREAPEDANVTPQYNASSLSWKIRKAVEVATQSDKRLFDSWFSGSERPQPFRELCV